MYINILLGYILGYLKIEIEGYFVEKLINICISKKIFLWNIKKTKSTIAYANIRIKDFKKLRHIVKNTKCRVKIIGKKGLPFIFNRYKKRKIFVAMLALFITITIILSNFIWNIDIVGNENISYDEIIKTLQENGLKTGILKNKINTKEIVSNIRLERDDLSWIGIEIKGTNAIVRIVEADKKPNIINKDEYCNIVAKKPRNYYKG